MRGKSGEIVVGNKLGVWKARTIQRRPSSERWEASTIDLVVVVPWRTSDCDPNVDGEKLEVVRLTERPVETERDVCTRPYLNDSGSKSRTLTRTGILRSVLGALPS